MISYSYDHLHLASADALATAQWFADNFGAVVTNPWTEPNGVQHVMVNLNGVDIFVKSRAEKPTVESNSRRAYGLEHFSILSSDIDAAVVALKANGVTFVADISATPLPGVRHAFLNGPDDILIELMERKSV